MMRLVGAVVMTFAMSIIQVPDARAFGDDDRPASEPSNPDYAAGTAAIGAKQYDRAITSFEKVVDADPENADAMTYLGYSHRKLGDFETSLVWYQKALAADPDHRGATEYLGELYLHTGDLAKAEAQLARLDDLCFFGCKEYDALERAIDNHKTGRTTTKTPTW